jgi:hypothetical protein
MRVFVSYSHADAEFAKRLASELEIRGAGVWLDVKQIKLGDSVSMGIERALTTSDVVCLVLSRHSKLSRWVDREYRAALAEQLERPEGGLKIIPIRIDETALPTLIKDIRFADFRRDFSGAFEDLCDAIGIDPIQAPFVAICYELGLDDADATRDRLIDLLTKQDIEPWCGIWHAVSDGAEQLHRELNALCGTVPTVVTSDQVALFLASGDQRIALVPLEQISIEEVLEPRGGSSSAYRYELRMRGVTG